MRNFRLGMVPPSDRGQTVDWAENTLTELPPDHASKEPPSEHFYLVVFDGASSSIVQLPCRGEVVIGRGRDCDVELEESAVSREHAKITVADGRVTVTDLGSRNGTHVNGERVSGTRALAPGDTVHVCRSTLALHTSAGPVLSRSTLAMRELRRRIEAECVRSVGYHRPFALLALACGEAVDRELLGQTLERSLRLIDSSAWDGQDRLLILMPETDAASAHTSAERLSGEMRVAAPNLRIGFAICPDDGCEVDKLIEAVRGAARVSDGAHIATASECFETVEIGDRRALVADPAMSRLFALINRLAAVDLPVLVCGETGTGKELVATALHHRSRRRSEPLITVNCAAIPENLMESELLGYEKGAFSGALSSKLGLIEAANGGTIFLDEIGELSPGAQAKLLRVLEEKRFTRLGEVREREVDVRVIAATNRNLDAEVRAGRFRQDVFYRLSGAMLWLPPLRERHRELRLLAQLFLREACARASRQTMEISEGAMERLSRHLWPGNVRELKNTMEYLAAAISDAVLESWHVSERIGAEAPPALTAATAAEGAAAVPGVGSRPLREELRELERQRLAAALAAWEGGAGPGSGQGAATASSSAGSAPAAPGTPPPSTAFRPIGEELRELEKNRMAAALAATGGHRTRAAELIGMPLRTFLAKVKQYKLLPPEETPRRR